MLYNQFRIKRKLIKEKLIGSFAANSFDINNYVKTSIPYEWVSISANPKVKKITSSDYEETLISFLKAKSGQQNHPNLIIIGDTGSGKSSSLKYAISKSKKCHSCTDEKLCNHVPMIIEIDFLHEDLTYFQQSVKSKEQDDEDDFDVDEKSDSVVTKEEFWKTILVALDKFICMDSKIERYGFWPWLLKDFRTHLYLHLYRVFSNYEERIKNNELDEVSYEYIKKTIYIDTSPEYFLIYKLLQIAYSRKDYNGMCHLVIFDNLDSLEPLLQREALRISLKMNEILSCRSVIPMRPHTFSINSDAATFSEVLDHWSPDLFEVIKIRIQNMIKSDGDAKVLGKYLEEVFSYIISAKYRKDLFLNTCGISVRFALRNLYNFLLSPLIVWENDQLQLNSLRSNEFYQAYLCSETNSLFMYSKNFVNIFSLSISNKGIVFSTIKLRILHLLSKNSSNGLTIREIRNEMNLYGFNDTQICSAINDLLRRRTALIWSDTHISYTDSDLNEPHILLLTPLGERYFNFLLSDVTFMRECITSKDNRRDKRIEVWLRRCWQVFKEIEKADYKEVITYLEKSTTFTYQITFDGPNSIGLILWQKLTKEFFYFEDRLKLGIDKNYENWLRKNILEILRTKMLSNFTFNPEETLYQ